MASTLLAVDDSVTIRRVLDITFTGTEHTVVTVGSADAAMQKLRSDHPDLVIADATLEPKSGYDLCAEIKQAAPATRVLILSSKQHPYDAAKGSAAGADDHIDKPFDTQQMIDRVQKLLESKAEAPAQAAAPVAARVTATQPSLAAPTPAAPPTAPPRAKTLMFGQGGATGMAPFVGGTPKPAAAAAPAAAPAPKAAPAPAPAAAHTAITSPPPAATTAAAGPPTAKAPSHVAQAVNGQLAGKLEGLGLTPAQVEAVTALSREIVERVVWEVVPVLAETLIKEEIARLTK